MRMFIVGLVAVLFASAGCESSNAAPKTSAGSAVKAPSAKAGSATDPWGAQPPAKAGSGTGSATTPAQKPAVTEKSEGTDAKSAKDDGAKKSNASGEGNWQCTASSSVRVCGFAGACNYQMVFGNGWGKDRFFAQKQAKSSCEASARAKGAVAVCVVQCSVK